MVTIKFKPVRMEVWVLPSLLRSTTGYPRCTEGCTISGWPILPGALFLPVLTSITTFALLEGGKILLRETSEFIWKDFHRVEKKYTVTI